MRSQHELHLMVRDILGEHYLTLDIPGYVLTEDLTETAAEIQCRLVVTNGTNEVTSVTGKGVGMVDALFDGLTSALSADYPSLETIHFVDFRVRGDFAEGTGDAKSDAPGRFELKVENAFGRRFQFENTNVSLSAGAVRVVIEAVQHFVNSERAVLTVFDWIDDAKRRHRPDLADTYVQRLAELMVNASYSRTIERRKALAEA